ncbi:6-carboxytetrahydropterin synthase QueD [Spirochaeta thermophila]|uniref:6-carboxy-5,6,7,8-tetrahydropterin synthase n=1 Tax=Winmispira thermophila (strain ATCC 49972 / DSM 6192 / RI 19.B1) TaxID=665571 RepID=E0RP28_WINT6|nr:6-carboxytetrahydropterin synthase QueD [Spirochaeta thermophila]ADN02691.1 putative 6-pyruvoyl tetrahydropterin synthase [Spirochaeta thermophila DSM 6192]
MAPSYQGDERADKAVYVVRAEGTFAAAHYLSSYHGKCETLHGHNYRVRAYAAGRKLDEGGMVLDFGILKKALREVLARLDHTNLNDHPFFQENPSAERIATYVYEEMVKKLPGTPIWKVEVFETDENLAIYLPYGDTFPPLP